MTGRLCARWLITPATPPLPHRRCGACNATRAFVSSGAIRLNANGKRLDAWLIYRCATCERTWNRPILERGLVGAIDREDLEAMQHSRPDWVAAHEFDLDALARHSRRIELSAEVRIEKRAVQTPRAASSTLRLEIVAERPTGLRLDRLLARELGVSRALLGRLERSGAVRPGAVKKAGLRAFVAGHMAVDWDMAALPEVWRRLIRDALFDGRGAS